MKRLITFYLTATVMLALVPIAMAANTTIVVWPGNVNGWSYTNFGTDASQSFVDGPDTPPLGAGSSSFIHETPPGFNGGTLHTANLNGIYLKDITELKYSTYQMGVDALLYQPPYVQIFLDLDDDGFVDDGIGFEPSWQNGGRFMVSSLKGVQLSAPNINVIQNDLDSTNAGVAANTWFEWDLLVGSWWGRGGLLSTGTGGPSDKLGAFECNQFTGGCVTIEAILDVYPDAKIISQDGLTGTGGVRLQYGFGGNSHEYIGHVDKLVIGVTAEDVEDTITYDFELGPTSKDSCKKDGWLGFFKNQGQCVSFFVSNRPN